MTRWQSDYEEMRPHDQGTAVILIWQAGAFSCYEDPSYPNLRIPETEIWENKVESMGEMYRTQHMDTKKSDRE